MTGNEFIRKVKAYGKKQNIAMTLNASRGKGGHQTLYFGRLSNDVGLRSETANPTYKRAHCTACVLSSVLKQLICEVCNGTF